MIDVRYMLAFAGKFLCSASSRREYRVGTDNMIHALIKRADELVEGDLLRVCWCALAGSR